MKNTELHSLINNLLDTPKAQRRFMRKALNRSMPGILNNKEFNTAYNAEAEKRGVERRLEMHRNACLQAYTAKKNKVESGESTHKFIHPATP